MPDDLEQGEQMKPEEQQTREIEALPGESVHARLKRISQTPRVMMRLPVACLAVYRLAAVVPTCDEAIAHGDRGTC